MIEIMKIVEEVIKDAQFTDGVAVVESYLMEQLKIAHSSYMEGFKAGLSEKAND